MPRTAGAHASTPRAPAARAGFTILQLLAVVAATMLLVGLLIPALKRQVESARSTRCREHLRRIQDALWKYRGSNDGWWPQRQITTQSGLTMDSNVWVTLLVEGRWEAEITTFTCPSDPNAPDRSSATEEYVQRAVAYAPSYGLNQLTWRAYGVAPSDDAHVRCDPQNEDISRIILLADRGPDYAEDQLPGNEAERRMLLERSRDAGRLPPDDDFRVGMVDSPPSWLAARHGQSINLISMGGIVAKNQRVDLLAARPPQAYYDDCATGGCSFCNVLRAPHYDFSSSDLFFWRGPYLCGQPGAVGAAGGGGPNGED